MSDEFNFSTGMPSDEMAEYVQMFVDETSEQLDNLVDVLLVLETKPNSPSELNESFRLIHSIKGAAAMMGLDSITLLTHHLENHFEHLRSGIETLDKSMMNLILKCVDFLRNAVDMLREGRPLVSAPELIEQLSRSVAEIRSAAATTAPSAVSNVGLDATDVTTVGPLVVDATSAAEATSKSQVVSEQKRVIVYLDRSIDLPELKAELIIARLSDLAIISRTSPDIDNLASLAELRTLQVWLETTRSDSDVRSAADVVGVDLVEIDNIDVEPMVEPMSSAVHATREAIEPRGSSEGPIHVGDEPTTFSENATVDEAPSGATASVSQSIAVPETPDPQSKVVETLRVDIQRLDRLMNLAGELVVNRARFVQLASQMADTFKKSGLISQVRDLCELLREPSTTGPQSDDMETRATDERYSEIRSTVVALEEQLHTLERGRRSFIQLNEAIDQFSRVSDGLQRGVLDTRMVPVGPLFNRFKRTVRDISSELGKKVNFIIRGENTELDKRMIDELGDPLVHLVRNAIDHGLESEAVRRNRAKPEAGTLTLEAAHSGNNVLITISDDGGGINTDKVKRRAIERGIVTTIEADMMSDYEIAQFIWAPGFSTAEVVSDISGRGVGMDIVKTRISELNGTIEVDSTLGKGAKFVIRLPLTLAIIRSLLFRLQQGTFAAPIENVREIVSVRDKDVISVHGRDSIEVRGEFIPLVRIEDVFDWHGTRYAYTTETEIESETTGDTSSILILTSGTKSMGLVVAALKGCQDIVVKSLDENFTHIRGLAGASILGDGSVCLLLDVVSCLELARQRLRDRPPQRPMTSV
ncbi:MAG: chemotaxis protein CheA [Planctomycetota bacterium]|nr:chemotaxis protein CheA [Planctomycetota bacterium]